MMFFDTCSDGKLEMVDDWIVECIKPSFLAKRKGRQFYQNYLPFMVAGEGLENGLRVIASRRLAVPGISAPPLHPPPAAGVRDPQRAPLVGLITRTQARRFLSQNEKETPCASLFRFGTLHQKRYFTFLCYRGRFLLHKPEVKRMTPGLFHFPL